MRVHFGPVFFFGSLARITSEMTPMARSNKNGCLSPSGTTEVFMIRKQQMAIDIKNRPSLFSLLMTEVFLSMQKLESLSVL
jgi:hypothetical protein